MKLIVFSDSHGRTAMMKRAAEAHFDDPDTAGIVHLGDGYEDLSLIDTRGLPVWRVRGNFEDHMYAFSSRRDEVPRELLFSLGGYNILIIRALPAWALSRATASSICARTAWSCRMP